MTPTAPQPAPRSSPAAPVWPFVIAVTREMRLAEVIKATGLVEDVAAQACARLVRRGELRRVRTGVYAPTGGGA